MLILTKVGTNQLQIVVMRKRKIIRLCRMDDYYYRAFIVLNRERR